MYNCDNNLLMVPGDVDTILSCSFEDERIDRKRFHWRCEASAGLFWCTTTQEN